MRRTATAVSVFALCAALASPTWGQVSITGAGSGGAKPSSGGYTGPGNVSLSSGTWLAFYSFFAFSASTAGNQVARICKAGPTCTNINSLASGLPDAATISSFCASTCWVDTWKNQVTPGTLDLVNPGGADTITNIPVLTVSDLNSLPCATYTFGGGLRYNFTGAVTVTAQPISFTLVARKTASSNGVYIWGQQSGPGFRDIGSGGIRFYTGVSTAIDLTITNNAWIAYNGTQNGASSSLRDNGTNNSGTLGTNGLSGNSLELGDQNIDGDICEAGILTTGAISTTDQANLETNERSVGRWNF